MEEQITSCTLAALFEGFDTYLLSDMCFARDVRFYRTATTRLYQAGAVPATLGQFVYQWLADETDPSRVTLLKGLLEEFNCAP